MAKNRTGGNKSKASLKKDGHAKQFYTAYQWEQAGHYREAEAAYGKILQSNPQHVEANFRLGELYHKVGQSQRGLSYIRAAAASDPGRHDILIYYGYLLHLLGYLDESVAAWQQALVLQPDNARTYNELSKVWRDKGQFDEAINCIRQALVLKPNYAEAHANLAYALAGTGHIDEAMECYRKALAIEPGLARAHYGLAHGIKHTTYSDDIKLMEQQYQSADNPSENRMILAYGLGKVYEDLQRFDEAFAMFAEANRIQRQTYQYSTDDQAKLMESFRAAFGGDFIKRFAGEGIDDDCPIFILGMPRSGTSLVEQILASHPLVHGAGEVNYLRVFAEGVQPLTGKPFPQGIEQVVPQLLREMAMRYIRLLKQNAGGRPHVTDKQLYNIHCVGLIHAVMPNAKIIHCLRDPMDNCLSIFTNIFTSAGGYASDLEELGQYYRLYEELMAYWHQLLPGKIHTVQYENIVANAEQETRRLLDYCRLPFDEACLTFHKTERAVNTPSAVQVRQPMYKSSVERWKRYEQQLQPLKTALGTV